MGILKALPRVILAGILLAGLVSCQEEEIDPVGQWKDILMSTGWKIDRYIYHFADGRDEAEDDSLALNIFRSDSTDDSRVIYTARWIVFESATIARTAFNYDTYSREKGETLWQPQGKNITAEAMTDWGTGTDRRLYLSLFGSRPTLIEVTGTDRLVLRDAYQIESVQSMTFGSGTLTFLFGDYAPGVLDRIDAVYVADSTGPNWFPPWPYWH